MTQKQAVRLIVGSNGLMFVEMEAVLAYASSLNLRDPASA